MKKILALGAHYDDVEIGVGGTLLKHVQGGDTVFIAVTSSNESRTGSVSIRYKEQIKALSLINIPTCNLLLFSDEQNDFDIIGKLDSLDVDVVYSMFEFDTHQAHRRSSYIGQSVGRKLTKQVVFYNSGSSYNFTPNAFSIIDFDFKRKLLNCFESQINLSAIDVDIIQRRESFWASLIVDYPAYVEGLLVRKMLYIV